MHLFAIRQLFIELLASVGTLVAQIVKGVVVFTNLVLFESQVDVFHLELVLTLCLNPFEWLLALSIDPMLQIRDHLSVLLLTEDVVLQLIAFDLLKTFGLFECVNVECIVLFVEGLPVLSFDLNDCCIRKESR